MKLQQHIALFFIMLNILHSTVASIRRSILQGSRSIMTKRSDASKTIPKTSPPRFEKKPRKTSLLQVKDGSQMDELKKPFHRDYIPKKQRANLKMKESGSSSSGSSGHSVSSNRSTSSNSNSKSSKQGESTTPSSDDRPKSRHAGSSPAAPHTASGPRVG